MTISWMRMATEFCSSCWVMLRVVLRSALTANTISCRTARNTIMPTAVKTMPGSQGMPSSLRWTRSASWLAWMPMPRTTALVSISVMPTEIAGMRPASAVVKKSPIVVPGLASQTRRSTCGRAAVVPRTDCFRFSQRPRRSLGPSGCCGGSRVGSPVRPLLAGPLSGRRRPPHLPHQMTGPWESGGIIPMWMRAYARPVDRASLTV